MPARHHRHGDELIVVDAKGAAAAQSLLTTSAPFVFNQTPANNRGGPSRPANFWWMNRISKEFIETTRRGYAVCRLGAVLP